MGCPTSLLEFPSLTCPVPPSSVLHAPDIVTSHCAPRSRKYIGLLTCPGHVRLVSPLFSLPLVCLLHCSLQECFLRRAPPIELPCVPFQVWFCLGNSQAQRSTHSLVFWTPTWLKSQRLWKLDLYWSPLTFLVGSGHRETEEGLFLLKFKTKKGYFSFFHHQSCYLRYNPPVSANMNRIWSWICSPRESAPQDESCSFPDRQPVTKITVTHRASFHSFVLNYTNEWISQTPHPYSCLLHNESQFSLDFKRIWTWRLTYFGISLLFSCWVMDPDSHFSLFYSLHVFPPLFRILQWSMLLFTSAAPIFSLWAILPS